METIKRHETSPGKRTRPSWRRACAGIGTALFLAAAVSAGPGPGGMDHGMGPRGHGGPEGHDGVEMFLSPRMLRELGLSADQEKKLRAIHLEAEKKKIQLHADKATLELDLRNAFATYPVDKAAALRLAEKVAEADKRMILHRVETLSQVLGTLTAEQHAKLLSLQEEWREKRRAWREEWRKDGFERRDRKGDGKGRKGSD